MANGHDAAGELEEEEVERERLVRAAVSWPQPSQTAGDVAAKSRALLLARWTIDGQLPNLPRGVP